MAADDIRIPDSFDIAKESGGTEIEIQLKMHIQTAQNLLLVGESGRNLEIVACLLGGGRIKICEWIDDRTVPNFSGGVYNISRTQWRRDQPGHTCSRSNINACS